MQLISGAARRGGTRWWEITPPEQFPCSNTLLGCLGSRGKPTAWNYYNLMQKPNQPDYILMSYKIPYYLQDGCLNEYVYYQQCMRHNPHIFENRLIHSLPFAGALSNCSKSKQVFNQCQEYRERELFEDMRRIYVESVRKGKEQ